MSDQPPQPNKASVFTELVLIGGAIAMGLAVGYIVLSYAMIPGLGFPGGLQRIMLVDERLSQNASDARIVIVSNSVGVEVVEGKVVERQLGSGFSVENQSANGLDLLSARIYIGRVLESEPHMLVWIIRPEMMGRIDKINPEVASAMRYSDFDRTADWIVTEQVPGLDDKSIELLQASNIENRLSLRTLPLRHLNEQVRTRTRKGILPAKPLEVDAPFQIAVNLTGDKLQRHIDDVTDSFHVRTAGEVRDGFGFIERTVEQIRSTSTIPVLVAAPTHPLADDFTQADEEFVDGLIEIAERTGVRVIDLSGTLSPEEFADAIHPNREGAEHLSRLLGSALNSTAGVRD
ncbi:MAG: SGNH/GDSL hydrolase family protein [Phycisphaerales bacterium]